MPTTKTKARSRQRTAPPTDRPAPAALPATIAALALLADGYEADTINRHFLAAWPQMPAVVAQLIRGEGSSNRGVTVSSLVTTTYEKEIAKHRAGTEFAHGDRIVRQFAAAIEADPDAYGMLYVTLAEPAFQIGVALGLFLATSTTPIPVGAR